ncbi:hypothetical protein EDB89DRAFT_1984315 [Lactarius sanguifluus]|nr:hypothetical protein EDB89DRAFT_2002764 [Lactarius sanguifluus]KAH9169481.1 hypothetical protein EDB89DRAFT_1984315 [Lactarius sanguifluus]
MGLHPDLREFTTIIASREDLGAYHDFCAMLAELMSDARATDTNRLVDRVLSYIPFNISTDPIPLLPPGDKSRRGWNHDATAAALCPLKLRTQFKLDPIGFRNSVQSGTLRIKTGDYPCFLYPHDITYDPGDRAKGLFRGHIFIRALRSVYTGPSSAFTGHRTAARASNSELNGMTQVSPEMVAYISVQTHYALSDIGNWGDISRSSFQYQRFFKNIIKLFRNRDSAWVIETLKYLTNELPTLKRRCRGHNNDPDSDPDQDSEDETETMLAQQRDNDTGEPQDDDTPAEEYRQHDATEDPTPPQSSPTPPSHGTPDPQCGSSSHNTAANNPAPTQEARYTPAAANNSLRRSRSAESEEDEQPRQKQNPLEGPLRITIPSLRPRATRRKRRKY